MPARPVAANHAALLLLVVMIHMYSYAPMSGKDLGPAFHRLAAG
jgi:hypothetical protein